MSIFQKCQVNVAKGLSEKHVVSIMLRIRIFWFKMSLHTFLSVLCGKGFRTKSCSIVRTKWSNPEPQIVQANLNARIATTLPSDKVNIQDIYSLHYINGDIWSQMNALLQLSSFALVVINININMHIHIHIHR